MKVRRGGIFICLALISALVACAYQGYELPPEEETTAYSTGRMVLMVEDLPMPMSQVEYTHWITVPQSAVPPPAVEQSPVAQPPEPSANLPDISTDPAVNAAQPTAAPQAPVHQAAARYHAGISIMPPTIAQVNAFLAGNPTKRGVGYLENGSLDTQTRQSALNHVNNIRYIAGVPANVAWDDAKTEMAEATAVVMVANGNINHYPARPAGISDEVYRMAAEGARTSNLARSSFFDVINGSIRQFLGDSERSNLPELGHRRWMLNPRLGKTAFGALGAYCVMTIMDTSNTQAGPEHSVVMYPGQVTPVDYFQNRWPWSVSFSGEFNIRNARAIMVRRGDGTAWQFGGGRSDGDFYINTVAFGQPGCVIFRPRGIFIKAGDVFDVQITGVLKNGRDWLVQYTVQFI